MRKKIVNYNEEFAYNCNAEIYCDTALESYYNYESIYQQLLKSTDFEDDYLKVMDKLDKNFINCIVYSQMCIESLLNYYILLYLDKETSEEIFDKLNIKQKLIFISKVLFNKKINKGTLLFDSVGILVKKRNELVHNKTKYMKYSDEPEYNLEDLKQDISEKFKIIRKAIIAIIQTATFLEDNKHENYMLEMLFLCDAEKLEEQKYREMAVKDFKIKMSIDDFQEKLMKFKFKTQPYQQDAVSNICRVFKGQPYHDMVRYTRDLGIKKKNDGLTQAMMMDLKMQRFSLKMLKYLRILKIFNKITTTKHLNHLQVDLEDVRLMLKWKLVLVKPMFT